MFDCLRYKLVTRRYQVAASSALAVVASSFPAFASGPDSPAPMTSLLGSFTEVAAWMWKEIGLLLTWILGQPILLLSMSLFFIGAIVSFFIRVFHSV